MNKKIIISIIMFVLLLSLVTAEDDNQGVFEEEDVYADIGDVEIQEDAGLTPDNMFYFIDELLEKLLVGDDPEKALRYKEEKINEAKQMINQGNAEAAKEAFEGAKKYGEILKREVSPEIEKRARESSKAVKEFIDDIEDDIKGNEWEDVRMLVEDQEQTEDKIALAAKITTQIQRLCKALSELDPMEYAKVCKTDDDAPRWRRRLDKELTEEQKKEAKEFFEIMSNCFKNPRECECNRITIKSFAEKCSEIAP
ncbi:hypothetical protein KY342_01405, partial [Candidatus Woesearchaeota archaeon]|nr:hypothetical protein [Candidatus Woesearchaeota archaeon]